MIERLFDVNGCWKISGKISIKSRYNSYKKWWLSLREVSYSCRDRSAETAKNSHNRGYPFVTSSLATSLPSHNHLVLCPSVCIYLPAGIYSRRLGRGSSISTPKGFPPVQPVERLGKDSWTCMKYTLPPSRNSPRSYMAHHLGWNFTL